MINFVGSLTASIPFINQPTWTGWLLWAAMLGVMIWLRYKWLVFRSTTQKKFWLIFSGLFVLTPFANLFLGLYINNNGIMAWPGMPIESPGAAMMFFSALPWLLAGGILSPTAALLLGIFAGILRAPWDTHTFFTALQFGLLGMIFSVSVRQRYRTFWYRALRQPILAVLILVPVFGILYIIGVFLSATYPDIAIRLDFALSNASAATLAFAGEVILAGIILQTLVFINPAAWGRHQPLQPSPAERRLETRFLIGTGSLVVALLLTLLIGDWIVAGKAATRMLEERLGNTARISAESVPFFLETGQNLGQQLAADPALLDDDPTLLNELLREKINIIPYFTQLLLLDNSGNILAEYPRGNEQTRQLAPNESTGIVLASNGIPVQLYTIPPVKVGQAARVSFLFAIANEIGEFSRVLVGRTDLTSNPLTQPLLNSLDSITSLGGKGLLLNQDGEILYSNNLQSVMETYQGEIFDEAAFRNGSSSFGTRDLIYFQPALGQPWSIVLIVPAKQVQQLSLEIAAPLSAMIFILALIALLSLRLGLRGISQSLESLAHEAVRIAQGQLDHPLKITGMDEVGQLRRAFEQMRVSLRDRLEELNQLLVVSRGVASSLDMKNAFQPVLDAILATGASAVQVILAPEITPDTTIKMPTRFTSGTQADRYAHLDNIILARVSEQEKIVLPNIARTSGGLPIDPTRPMPAALLAIALKTENRFYGTLWASYDHPRLFNEADIRFINTLGGQAALAAANAHLFLSVEIARQQLASILDSTADPVLVTDHQDRLLLANPAAWQILGIVAGEDDLRPISEAIAQPELRSMMKAASTLRESAEITLPGGQTFLATASSVIAEGQPIGRVCILRDVTHFKELDTLKSEFVATVSHDLRSPLTLMRGYATMLAMVGEINDQQRGYLDKIVLGVENMSRLVNDLLDIGRIELGVGLKLEETDIVEIIDRITTALKQQAQKKKIALEVQTAPNLPGAIQADPSLLHQALYNLVENAIKYTKDDGEVVIRIYTDRDKAHFEIRDTGIGIKQADLPRLFEKFYRGTHREAHQQRGTGLGLAIVRSVIEKHGGRTWVESVLNKGSVFHVEIPIEQPKSTGAS
ncbi:MAG: ATP-binding protein [Anaerolineales bacterium]|nr:ATP-binding protein [Anaerolineales bacterium]